MKRLEVHQRWRVMFAWSDRMEDHIHYRFCFLIDLQRRRRIETIKMLKKAAIAIKVIRQGASMRSPSQLISRPFLIKA